MKQEDFCRALSRQAGEAPEAFHQRVEDFLAARVREEQDGKRRTYAPRWTLRRRLLVLALLAALLLGTAAMAARHWRMFDALHAQLGVQPPTADSVLQAELYRETVNGVTITVTEAGYDGKTLFVQYTYRLPHVSEPMGQYRRNGSTRLISQRELEQLAQYNVGWWVDALWINGACLDMPGGSGGTWSGSELPGELVRTEYWRLDRAGVQLTGDAVITLPVGAQPSAACRSALWDQETEQYALPEQGVVTFTLPTEDILRRVETLHSGLRTVTPDVTARVQELTLTPLMTYITLELTVNPASLAALREACGEGVYHADGTLLHAWTGADVFGGWMASLTLVDGEGQVLFPGHSGIDSCGSDRAEYLFPHLAQVPEELWLACVTEGVADMNTAIRVK